MKSVSPLKSIFRQFDYLNIWYGNSFINRNLNGEEFKNFEIKNVSNGYETIIISNIIAQQYPNNPPKLLFEKVSYSLANCITKKWYTQSKELLDIINEGLGTKFLKGRLSFKSAAWFIIVIAKLVNVQLFFIYYLISH